MRCLTFPSLFPNLLALILGTLAAGAQEVWIVGHDGRVEVHDTQGLQDSSRYGALPSLPPPAALLASLPASNDDTATS